MAHDTNPLMAALRLGARAIATVIVVIWTALDELLFAPLRPLIAWLSQLRLFEALGGLVGRLPPYVVLVLLAVPFVLIEPLKILALYWIATGLFIRGAVLLVVSYVLSIFTLDRLYHTGRSQLMKIGWFARLMAWVTGLRDWAFGWVKATALWKWATGIGAGVRDWFRTLVRSTR